jgi:hypothetical protein
MHRRPIIHSVRCPQTTQLRPSSHCLSSMTNTVPLCRSDSLFKSQMPIRINCGPWNRTTILYNASSLSSSSFTPCSSIQTTPSSTSQPFAFQVMRTLSSASPTGQQQPIETVFKGYQLRVVHQKGKGKGWSFLLLSLLLKKSGYVSRSFIFHIFLTPYRNAASIARGRLYLLQKN